jgi:hypothetical protein
MTTLRFLSLALIVSSFAVTAAAQQRPADPASASVPHDCAKPMARHDHGAERGSPRPGSMSGPCSPAPGASAPKAKPLHDHATFHKNQ